MGRGMLTATFVIHPIILSIKFSQRPKPFTVIVTVDCHCLMLLLQLLIIVS